MTEQWQWVRRESGHAGRRRRGHPVIGAPMLSAEVLEARRLMSVGPNAAGYVARAPDVFEADVLSPDPGGANVLISEADDRSASFDLDVDTFTFYGTTYSGSNSLYVNVNGFVALGGPPFADRVWVNTDLNPSPLAPHTAMVSALWDDWVAPFGGPGEVLWKLDDGSGDGVADHLTVQWNNLRHHDWGDEGVTFQVVLELNTGERDGDVLFNYIDLDAGHPAANGGASATVGIRNADSPNSDPLLVSFSADEEDGSPFDTGVSPLVAEGHSILIRRQDAANAPPSAVEDAVEIVEDGSAQVHVLANDTDPDGVEGLAVTAFGSPTYGIVTQNGNLLTYEPQQNFSGTDSFTYEISDGSGATDEATVCVTVSPFADAPDLAVGAPAAADEPAAVPLGISAGLVDLDGSEELSVTVTGVLGGASLSAGTNLGGGAWALTPSQLPGLTLNAADNLNATLTVVATATERATGGAASSTATINVRVNNVAPTARPDAVGTAEDTAVTFNVLSNDTDPAGAADPLAVVMGAPAHGTVAAQAGGSFIYTPGRDFSGTDTCTYTVSDGDGGTDTGTVTVTVAPVADRPGLSVMPAASGSEGGAIPLTISASLADESEGLAVRITNVPAGATLSNGARDGEGAWLLTPAQLSGLTITVPDDAGFTLSAAARSTESDGSFAEASGTIGVTVNNVAPSVTITGPASGSIFAGGTAATLAGGFTDPGLLDTHGAYWTLTSQSSGAVTTVPASGVVAGGTVTGAVNTAAAPLEPGVYRVSLIVTDDDRGTGTATTVGGLDAMIVVYDATEGFVTGGGWINSKAGSFVANPALTGRASFGFVSRYQKYASVPGGHTTFQFSLGNFSFQSTSYDWMVVNGFKAQYAGSGKVNGVSGYRFSVTAIDGERTGGGGVDKFRIRIWGPSGLVYDNQLGDVDDANPITALGGGSIVIHS